jgi:hypothetical protein
MLVWPANFQIPNSGTQSAFVFLFAEVEGNIATLNFYSEETRTNLLWSEELEYTSNEEIYTYILSLEKYKEYKRGN